MNPFLKVIIEIGIMLLIIVAVLGATTLAFYDKVPFGTIIPESINYTKIDKSKYEVRGDVEEATADTKTYVSTKGELQTIEVEKIVSPGRIHPFGSINSGTDLPTEKVQSQSEELVPSGEGEFDIGDLLAEQAKSLGYDVEPSESE